MTKTCWQTNLASPGLSTSPEAPEPISVAVAALEAAIAPVPVEERQEIQRQLATRLLGTLPQPVFRQPDVTGLHGSDLPERRIGFGLIDSPRSLDGIHVAGLGRFAARLSR
jgi:hypothetical protein